MKIVYILGFLEDTNSELYRKISKSLIHEKHRVLLVKLFKHSNFGKKSFFSTIEDLDKIFLKNKPDIIIAHSLGAYIALQTRFKIKAIFIEPSYSLKDIIKNNISGSLYCDNIYRIPLSKEFIDTYKSVPSIKKSIEKTKVKVVYIIGAGKGGHKVSRYYHKLLHGSKFTIFPNANHNFSNKKYLQQVVIKITEIIQNLNSLNNHKIT